MNKKKIINDPVYGFITLKSELIFDIISHPYFQRLRHIKQLGLTDLIYPGALHTRFQHALGAMHLMGLVLDNLRQKKVEISNEEYEATQIAILLHDLGHGPFSHALEDSLLQGIKHESISYMLMLELNDHFNQALSLALKIFRNSYSRKFFHQLVSSQLDIDRLDYLKRDCFFTGVQEGTIGVDRIISMLHVYKDQLVVEEKGIYSIENFLTARRLMYWQVYLHKTTVSAERMLVNIIKRAQTLMRAEADIPASDALKFFLANNLSISDLKQDKKALHAFGVLDDNDIWGAIKCWINNNDKILSTLSRMLLERRLFKIILSSDPIKKNLIERIRTDVSKKYKTLRAESQYLFSYGTVTNEAYAEGQKINILTKKGELLDIAQASDLPNIKAFSRIVKKNYLCWPKDITV
ncbi:HD domain-containing protein [Chryseosolibacter indicus]|uniref:HD domain-containing protein n=1 Tax=Chryseosolibacter indicus TaxID=2782351 RepID=A0ABS5VLX3_9BACT|nr:HD domain-containing protein [Chryseosolibacter indicus]MBT1702445.1 HD domain-containing protein [Chryseosolibacter indicus]